MPFLFCWLLPSSYLWYGPRFILICLACFIYLSMAPIIFLAFARLYMPWQLVGQGGGLGNHFFFIGFGPFCFFGFGLLAPACFFGIGHTRWLILPSIISYFIFVKSGYFYGFPVLLLFRGALRFSCFLLHVCPAC